MTVPHYGKRNPGGLTAASPGDTLYFNFASYNDSGDSEALSGLAVSDIEVIKDGSATVRATDSGYSLISDTGQVGDRVGLYRCRIQLFNTADDPSFYAVGSWYQAFVDSVTIDGKTVRFWLGSWEIGEPRANIVQIGGDTGAADVIGKFGTKLAADGEIDTGTGDSTSKLQVGAPASTVDTGVVNQAVWQGNATRVLTANTNLANLAVNVTQVTGDTGAAAHLKRIVDEYDTGRLAADATATLDTGAVNQAVWQGNATRILTANTNLAGLQVDVVQIGGDTGSADVLKKATNGVGGVSFSAGINMNSSSDTGINQRLAQIQSDVDTGLRVHIDDSDTGVKDAIADLDTGLRGVLQTTGVNVSRLDGDTGAADQLAKAFATTPSYFQQVDIQLIDADTGAATHLQQLVANGFNDTGINDHLGRIRADVDTGLRAQISDVDTGLHDAIDAVDTGLHAVIAAQDTGFVANAVWNAARADHVAVGSFGQYVTANVDLIDADTGAATHLQQAAAASQHILSDVRRLNNDTGAAGWLANTFLVGFNDTGVNQRLAQIQSDVDTGLRAQIADVDTGLHDALADLDTGLRDYIDNTDTGIRAFIDNVDTGLHGVIAAQDTGFTANAVWNALRADHVAAGSFGEYVLSDAQRVDGDTGTADRLHKFADQLSAAGLLDTGTLAGTKPGTIDANVTHVNETAVGGTGADNDPWGPA